VPFGRLVSGHVHLQLCADRRIVAVRPQRLFDDGVQDAKPPDGGGSGIRQERISNAMPLAEVRQDRGRVVADGGQPDAVLTQFFDAALQLDELRAAVRSPVRGAEEHQHRAARSHDRLQVVRATVLIVQVEVRHALTHLRPQSGDVNLLARGLGAPGGRGCRRWSEEQGG
jgi:hypothetical protein